MQTNSLEASEIDEKTSAFIQKLSALDLSSLASFAKSYVFNVGGKTKERLIAELLNSGYSIKQMGTKLEQVTDMSGGPIVDVIYNSEFPIAKLGWKILGDNVYKKKVPGFSTEQSARIALSKEPEWKAMKARITSFRFKDSTGGFDPASKVVERFAVVVKTEQP